MGVVAASAVFQDVGSVFVGSDERFLVMTVEAPSLEAKSPTPAQTVTLGAFRGHGRMLLKGTEGRRRVFSHEESDLTPSPLPDQCQPVFSRRGFQLGVEDVGERLLGRDLLTVQLQPRPRTGRHDADLFRGERRAVLRTQDPAWPREDPRPRRSMTAGSASVPRVGSS